MIDSSDFECSKWLQIQKMELKMEQRNENTHADQAVSADPAAVTAKKLPWEKPEFASVQPLSETHAVGGAGIDGGANQS